MHYKIDQRTEVSFGLNFNLAAVEDQKVHRSLMSRYFNAKGIGIMVVSTLALLLLPLVLPPLPPPPVLVLFVPVLLLALLLYFAFLPSKVPTLEINSGNDP
ncbi:unnamed protein product [Coffea canephora]|uniref:ARGOS-like protein n=1 Tax=Coffea canephora TaxID=49390 RepID=A0A068UM56_COFCA|nr:unnamed protein product [Coffea canephora]